MKPLFLLFVSCVSFSALTDARLKGRKSYGGTRDFLVDNSDELEKESPSHYFQRPAKSEESSQKIKSTSGSIKPANGQGKSSMGYLELLNLLNNLPLKRRTTSNENRNKNTNTNANENLPQGDSAENEIPLESDVQGKSQTQSQLQAEQEPEQQKMASRLEKKENTVVKPVKDPSGQVVGVEIDFEMEMPDPSELKVSRSLNNQIRISSTTPKPQLKTQSQTQTLDLNSPFKSLFDMLFPRKQKSKSKTTGTSSSSSSSTSQIKNLDKCAGITCTPPPSDSGCEKLGVSLNVPSGSSLSGIEDCCPIYLCVSKVDGSFQTHYGVAGKAINPKNPQTEVTFEESHWSSSPSEKSKSKSSKVTPNSILKELKSEMKPLNNIFGNSFLDSLFSQDIDSLFTSLQKNTKKAEKEREEQKQEQQALINDPSPIFEMFSSLLKSDLVSKSLNRNPTSPLDFFQQLFPSSMKSFGSGSGSSSSSSSIISGGSGNGPTVVMTTFKIPRSRPHSHTHSSSKSNQQQKIQKLPSDILSMLGFPFPLSGGKSTFLSSSPTIVKSKPTLISVSSMSSSAPIPLLSLFQNQNSNQNQNQNLRDSLSNSNTFFL